MDLGDLRPQYSFADLHEGAEFRKSLRVKKTQGREGRMEDDLGT
jgi:hypothetical protein